MQSNLRTAEKCHMAIIEDAAQARRGAHHISVRYARSIGRSLVFFFEKFRKLIEVLGKPL